MAASSTNKQPLLIDRPLHVIARLDQTSQPAGSIDPGTGTNGVLLVDATGSSDGALVECLYLIQRKTGNEAIVNLFLSNSNQVLGTTTTGGQAQAWFVNTCKHEAATPAGYFIEFTLPFLLAPIPHAGASEAVPISRSALPIGMTPTAGVIQPPRYRGMRIPRGMALWAAVFQPAPDPDAPNIAVQGGWY
jgi:hypothetical protein